MAAPVTAAASAAIIAGGDARRLGGRTKPLLEIEGETILSRQLAALSARFDHIVISANEPAPFVAAGLPVIADRVPGAGPLAGIAAALRASPTPLLFALAGDMPFVHIDVIDVVLARARALARRRGTDEAWATAAVVGGRPEPLFAVYSRECARIIERRLGAGLRAARALFASGRSAGSAAGAQRGAGADEQAGSSWHVRLFPIPERAFRPLDPALRFLTNVNEPSDLP